jgi:hypothetical protein
MAPFEHYHVFSLPPALLDTLVPRTLFTQTPQEAPARSASPPLPASTIQHGASRACNICLGALFSDVDEQRAHFRSDWHRYNVKMRVGGSNAVTESQFGQLIDGMFLLRVSYVPTDCSFSPPGLEDSLSGSESSTSETDAAESEDDAVNTLVHKATKMKTNADDNENEDSARKRPNAPVVWFHSPPSTQIGVYKAVFRHNIASTSSASSGDEFLQELKALQFGGGESGRKWALFMTAGGHFAGAIVRVSRPDGEEYEEPGVTRRGKLKKPKPDTELLLHKTFHRYTSKSDIPL